ncbi:unnamed protein product, partial [Musa textilis]
NGYPGTHPRRPLVRHLRHHRGGGHRVLCGHDPTRGGEAPPLAPRTRACPRRGGLRFLWVSPLPFFLSHRSGSNGEGDGGPRRPPPLYPLF